MIVGKKIRFANCLIDLAVICVLSVLFNKLFNFLGVPSGTFSSWVVWGFQIMLLKGLYYFGMELYTGRTIGKMITNTIVVNKNKTKPSASAIFVRTLYRLLPFEVFSYLREDAQKGWHDSFSNTKVIKNNENMKA